MQQTGTEEHAGRGERQLPT
ncbi:hypothetical protein GQ600_20329 [Phytophthora cactorum]|nr:hypothetical protein GQ600_20329 [Phytophthora cactorum]